MSSRSWLLKLSLVPLLFIIFRLPGVVYRIAEFMCLYLHAALPPFFCSSPYLCLMTLGDASQATALFFIFVLLNEAARKHYINLLKCKPCRHLVVLPSCILFTNFRITLFKKIAQNLFLTHPLLVTGTPRPQFVLFCNKYFFM